MEKINRLNRLFITLAFSFLVLFSAAAQDDGGNLEFSITDWNTGSIEYGDVVEQPVKITNNTTENVTVDLISTCSCMTTYPESLDISAGESAEFTIVFDSHDDSGDFEKLLIIQTDSDAMPKGFFVVTGSVDVSSVSADAADDSAMPAEPESSDEKSGAEAAGVPRYYYTPGCKSCNRFLRDAEINIDKRDITEAEYYEELQQLLADRGTSLKEIPVFVTTEDIYQGEEAVMAGYTALLAGESGRDTGVSGENESKGNKSDGISMSLAAVLAAGLLDGVNPCAFTTLIFLLSALSVAGRSRRETLIIGLFFTVTVFITYYLIGLGFFKIIRIADSFELVSRIIRWVLFAVLVVFAGLSFYDYGKIRSGKTKDIILQLPDSVKRRMHDSIRSYTKSAALAGSSIVMGFLISIFELGCTGQIYFPTITYIIQTDKAASGYFYLALYNLAFIIPLAVVFIVVYLGITSKKITGIFQTNLGIIKILTGLLFLSFAVLMLIL